jgi:hypothetical protein
MLVAIVLSHSTYDDTTVAVRRRVLEPTFRSTPSQLMNFQGSVESPLERRTPCPTYSGVKS